MNYPPEIEHAVTIIKEGGIIAYPTEAIYGLGCDPFNEKAVSRLLKIKQRSIDKGLILIASCQTQINYLLQPISADIQKKLNDTWPGPVTWILSCKESVPNWIKGKHQKLAIRIPAHQTCFALCQKLGGPIVSTSANKKNQKPLYSSQAVIQHFKNDIDYVLPGKIGSETNPTEIRDAETDTVIRKA